MPCQGVHPSQAAAHSLVHAPVRQPYHFFNAVRQAEHAVFEVGMLHFAPVPCTVSKRQGAHTQH